MKGTPNESTDHPEINSGAELVETKYENIKEIGPKYEVEKTKFTHIEKHHQTKAAESSERYCVKVIGTTSEFTIVYLICILMEIYFTVFSLTWFKKKLSNNKVLYYTFRTILDVSLGHFKLA